MDGCYYYLPQYNWTSSNTVTNDKDIYKLIKHLLEAPVGILWLAMVNRTNEQGFGVYAHAQPLLRYGDGIIVIPTNAPDLTFEQFRGLMQPLNNIERITEALSDFRTLLSLTVIEVGGLYDSPVTRGISQRDCSGLGEGRRGSQTFPSRSIINQCTGGGRCALQ